jgi:hypothetical protein
MMMHQLIMFHKSNKKLESKMMMTTLIILQTEYPD